MEKVKLEIPIAGIPEEIEIYLIDLDKLVLDEIKRGLQPAKVDFIVKCIIR